jgi:hypothetical protein
MAREIAPPASRAEAATGADGGRGAGVIAQEAKIVRQF